MSATGERLVATLIFGGIPRAYTLSDLELLGVVREPPPVTPRPTIRIVNGGGNPVRRGDDRRLSKYRQVSALKMRAHAAEADALREALTAHNGFCKAAADALGIPVRTLFGKCRRLGIDIAAYRPAPFVFPPIEPPA